MMKAFVLLLCFTELTFADENKIIGGVSINITDAPYQVVVQLGGALICGGVILSPAVVATAGHCILRTTAHYSIRAGTSDHLIGGTVHPVVEIYVHPKYDDVLYDYDITLMKIDPPIQFDLTKQAISIRDAGPTEGIVTITGWGTLSENGMIPRQLQSVTVPVINNETCNKLYQVYGGISGRMFCAGSADHDSCQGDSGGPVVQDDGLVGLVSWAAGCAREAFPGVNVKLANSEIRQFIKNITGI